MANQLAQTARGAMEYRLAGAGPVVMVLNGGHCSRATRLSHERLADHGFTVLTPSRPGYDATPAATGRSAQAAADALAALLDTLNLQRAAVIGISAAGPTALALAQRHPDRVSRLVLESAVTWPWATATKRGSWLAFGPTEGLTWAFVRLALRLVPQAMLRIMLGALTSLDVGAVMQGMSSADLVFVRRVFETSRSGTGFMLDLQNEVSDLASIQAAVLVLHTPNDKAVPPRHAQRIGAEVAHSTVVAVPAESHLLWIGAAAQEVWERRLAFMQSAVVEA